MEDNERGIWLESELIPIPMITRRNSSFTQAKPKKPTYSVLPTDPPLLCIYLPYKTEEQAELIQMFATELDKASGDGGKKRAAGLKPSWKVDEEHEGAVYSHIMKWKRPKKHAVIDPESGTHTLVHAAWRLLAIALQELHPEWKGEHAETAG